MTVTIRPAEKKDIPFLGWVMLTSAQSHLDECPWSVIFAEDEARTRVLLENMMLIPAMPWCYVENFRIAEVNGKPAAAMCGFDPAARITPIITELDVAKQTFNYSEQQLVEISSRLEVAPLGFPDDCDTVWAIENVAVLDEFRGVGLIDQLFEYCLNEGRERGFKRAQIFSMIGNETGQRVFERNGFKIIAEKQNSAFEALFGTSGAKLMAQDLVQATFRRP